jgi:hypothetical protein
MKKVKSNKIIRAKVAELELALCLNPEMTTEDCEFVKTQLLSLIDNLQGVQVEPKINSVSNSEDNNGGKANYLHIFQGLHPVLN